MFQCWIHKTRWNRKIKGLEEDKCKLKIFMLKLFHFFLNLYKTVKYIDKKKCVNDKI